MPPAVVFALAPAKAIEGPLNYAKTEHQKIYRSGTTAVSDEPFNCESEQLFKFLREVRNRAVQMGWYDGILNIDINQDPNNAPKYKNLIRNYGTITLEQVLTSERSYIALEGRSAQDTHMLYQCLMVSLTGEAKKKVMIWSDQYEFEVNGVEYNSGVALLLHAYH
jgi:hypothetical protein